MELAAGETDKSSTVQLDVKCETTTSCNESLCANDNNITDFDAFCRFAFPETEPSDQATCSQPFYFESDHVALRDNDDYQRVLRAFVLLQSQRTSALRDLDVLLELQQTALRDPLEFVNELKHGRVKIPPTCKMADLPTVAWQRYTDDVEGVLASLGGAAHSTRHKQKRALLSGLSNSSRTHSNTTTSNTTNSTCSNTSTTSNDVNRCESEPDSKQQRPATFNQPWSSDEQRLLEQLLHKYPPERFEARRFAKIAAEMPGRTTQQVTSRVQKYFIKLAKVGLPVPGRVPSLAAHGGRWFNGRYHGYHQRYNHFYFPSSTFLTSYAPPVYMSDDDNDDDDDDVKQTPAAAAALSDCNDDDDDNDQSMSTLSADVRQSINSVHSSSHIDYDYTSHSVAGVSSYLDPNYMPAV